MMIFIYLYAFWMMLTGKRRLRVAVGAFIYITAELGIHECGSLVLFSNFFGIVDSPVGWQS